MKTALFGIDSLQRLFLFRKNIYFEVIQNGNKSNRVL